MANPEKMKMETQLENKLRVNILLDANLCRDFLVEFQDELTLSFVSKVLFMSISLAALTDASVSLASLTGNLLGNNMIKSEKSSNKEAIIGKPSHQAPIHR